MIQPPDLFIDATTDVGSKSAPIWRQMAAILYDAFLVLALWLVLTALLIPFHHHQGFKPHSIGYSLALLLVWFGFYAWCWQRSGQTVGMVAWRIKLINNTPQPLRYWQLVVRFCSAVISYFALGAGLFWKIADPAHLTLPDRLSRTTVVLAD